MDTPIRKQIKRIGPSIGEENVPSYQKNEIKRDKKADEFLERNFFYTEFNQ
jgi:hypothetical protein